MFVAVGSIIVDDIRAADGRLFEGVLGGGATHAAAGMCLWGPDVALVGSIGRDFPPEHWAALEALGLNLHAIRRLDRATPRAWQLYDADEHRTEIFRSPRDEFPAFLPTPDQLAPFVDARGFHLHTAQLDHVDALLTAMRARRAAVCWEPAPWHMVPEHRRTVLALLRRVDIVCPNGEECRTLLGPQPPEAWLTAFLEAGAALAAVRLGRAGSLVQARGDAAPVHVPAVALGPVVDVTGAGNAYGGGLLVGWARAIRAGPERSPRPQPKPPGAGEGGRSDAARIAGLHGAISAAVTLGAPGVPRITPAVQSQAAACLAAHGIGDLPPP
ncbi:MAG: PfkB family carbohydrate kinase [Armatimonadota bacterium]|nr:PfkB family carbohydrate kinase [Armatimonadota bacterium]MDR7459592.1 PfkB family carbohydrate kinase [Armatimonadota bacterium]MDR7478637.1 PfkB family carbohydrate kinase [Armatimonadota bacterium]MDR7488032.1 PfkB family carbohydrate kinase [Armatimonadota bacterium]MDR7489863.1 PfkB family carbohydrate kinase [Armatimonadota bacterium]